MSDGATATTAEAGDPTAVVGRVRSIEVIQVVGQFNRHPELGPELSASFSPVVAAGRLEDDSHLQVVVQFGARIDVVGDESRPAFTARAVFVVRYTLEPGTTPAEDDVGAFARFNGAFNAYPYWRHFLEESLFKTGLPRVALPPFIPGRHAAHAPEAISHHQTEGGRSS